MKQSLLFSLCIVLLLSVAAASTAVLIGEGPVKLSPDEYVNITPVNSTEAYEVPQATVLGALDAASILGAFEYEVTADLPPEEGNLSITSIAGVENEVRNETPYAWTFWVNDEEATTGPAVTNVTDGDNVTYSYGPPGHSVENASYTLNVYVSVPGAEVNVTPTPTPTPTAEANVTITSPEEGANITAGNVTVSVNVTNFTLVEPTGQANAPGEGHLHYYLDAVVPTNASAPAIPETGGYVVSTNTSYTWENVTPGAHNLSVQVVNNDHTPIIPLVFDTVNVTVGGNVTPTPTMNVTPTPTMNVTPTPTMNVTPTPTMNVTPTPTTTGNATAMVNLTAENIAFDTDTITVPAGANVTVNFNNKDSGIPHNFAVYDSSFRSERIFVGEIITGPATTNYTFTAPSEPGTYYFQCDVHPSMNGDFIVE